MVSRPLIIIGGGLIIFGLVFLFAPIPQSQPSTSIGVPAPGFEDVPEMIVEQEPVSMFCRIYPQFERCIN